MERVADLYGFTKQKVEEKKSSNGPPFKSFSRDEENSLIFCQNDQRIKTIIFCIVDHF